MPFNSSRVERGGDDGPVETPAGHPAGRWRGLPAGQVRCDVAIRQAGRAFT